jgi:hypothetical protein
MRLRTLALGTLAATAVTLALAGTANAATPTHRGDDITVRCDGPDELYRDGYSGVECAPWRTEPRRHELHTRACDRIEAVPAEPARPRLVVPAEPAEPTEPGLVVPAVPRAR